MIDSSMTIMLPSRLQWTHSLWLKVGENVLYREPSLERLARIDTPKRFQTRGRYERFWGREPTNFLQRWGLSNGVTILIWNLREERFRQEVNLTQGLARKCNHQIGNHHKDVGRVDCKVTNKCISFERPVASSYAQSNNSTSKQKFPITTSFRSWPRAAVRKFKFDAIPSEIWLGVEYQKYRGLFRLSNGYLLALIRSTV
jgi:hypothetical protein